MNKAMIVALSSLVLAACAGSVSEVPVSRSASHPDVAGALQGEAGGKKDDPQRIWASGVGTPTHEPLIAEAQREKILAAFRAKYGGDKPVRVLLYVNRDLVDQKSGWHLVGHAEHVDKSHYWGVVPTDSKTVQEKSADGSSKQESVSTPNRVIKTNEFGNAGIREVSIADRNTMRNAEARFGRQLRAGGAALVDQGVAVSMLGDRPLAGIAGSTDVAAKDREVVSKIADVVIEVLASNRRVTFVQSSGERDMLMPDFTATAIRLKDARILGQTTLSDAFGKNQMPQSWAAYDSDEIAQAMALVLMDDMAGK